MASKRKERKLRREIERPTPDGAVVVNLGSLRPYNSYGAPYFVELGFYRDVAFPCVDCGEPQLWRASQQKWWYEVAKGHVESRAIRCRTCRARERASRGIAKPRRAARETEGEQAVVESIAEPDAPVAPRDPHLDRAGRLAQDS